MNLFFKKFLFIFTLLIVVGCQNSNKETFTSGYPSPTTTTTTTTKQYKGENIYVYAFQGDISVYIKGSNNTSNKYIGYHFKHQINGLDKTLSGSNYDVWNLFGASEAERYESLGKSEFRITKNVVKSGEWELAIKEQGANDFTGGAIHGDEITTQVSLSVDGTVVELNKVTRKEAKEVKFTTKTDLFRDNTITTGLQKIAKHSKTYTFDKTGLKLEQEVEFSEPLVLDRSYLSMLPILRNDKEQITDTIEIDDKEYDVSNENFLIPELNYVKAKKVKIYGKNSGISATLEVLNRSPENQPLLMVSNAPIYNKIYFSFVGDGYKVSPGDRWTQVGKYMVDTVN